MTSVLITGATGFVGSAVLGAFHELGWSVVAPVRSTDCELPINIRQPVIYGIDADTDWSECLFDVDYVVHCAARVHVVSDRSSDPLAEFRKVNLDGTLALARQAAEAGVRRFIYISSVKVNGELTRDGAAFRYDDPPNPKDAYGLSKAEAEAALKVLSVETGMELVVIRPPLVYGPGVKGNFARLISLAASGIPLPLGAINNARSLVALDNLVDLIVLCVSHPNAAGEVFLVSDGESISTSSLLREVAEAMGKRCWLIPFPEILFRTMIGLFGKKAIVNRLFDSLEVDICHTRDVLGWSPRLTLQEGLSRAVGKT